MLKVTSKIINFLDQKNNVISAYRLFQRSDGKNLVFYPVPKNANSSFKKLFIEHLSIEKDYLFLDDDIPMHQKEKYKENFKNGNWLWSFLPPKPIFSLMPSNLDVIKLAIVRNPIERFLSAYNNRVLWHKDSDFNNCFSDSISTLTLETFNNFVNIKPAYKPNVFNPADELYVRIADFKEEQDFFKHLAYNQQLKKQNELLPPPSEVGLALLEKNVNDLDGPYVDYSISGRHRLHGEVVVGLFGDVHYSDLETMSNMIKTLHIVAPHLNIKYSDNAESVNLPIHFVPCTEYFSDKAYKCKNKYLGTYHFPRKNFYSKEKNVLGDYGWVWIDSQRSADLRSHVLVHEFAHALGLLHNKCYDSSVSYNSYAPEIAHFSVLDLMQLRVLYDPNLDVVVNSKQIIRDLNLDEEKYKKHKENNSTKSLCHMEQGGWDNLIDFQLGLFDYELIEGGSSA